MLSVACYEDLGLVIQDFLYRGFPFHHNLLWSENITFTGPGVDDLTSVAFSGRIVRLAARQDCRIAFGVAPTTNANSIVMLGGTTETFVVNVGDFLAVQEI